MNKINVGIAGCMGRMGRNLVRSVHLSKDLNFIGGFESPNNKNIGKIAKIKIERSNQNNLFGKILNSTKEKAA